MAYLSLYRKYRPQGFDEVDGQEHVTRTLRNAIRLGQIAHAYLFAGPRGTGKTSTARVLASALNCAQGEGPTPDPCRVCDRCVGIRQGSALDVIEIDAASNRGIDEIRALRERVQYAAAEGRYKVYIIDEVHMLTPEAFNALLKTLEEPPAHVIFVMCTTEPHKLPPTILSRCQRFDFHRLPLEAITKRLQAIAQHEKLTADAEALALLARAADGSMRDGISLLDQAATYADAKITAQDVQAMLGGVEADLLLGLADAMAERDLGKAFGLIADAVNLGKDMRQVTTELIAHLRGLLMASGGERGRALLEVPADLAERMVEQAKRFDMAGLTEALRHLAETEKDMRYSSHPRLLLELAMVRLCAPGEAAPRPPRPQAAAPAASAPTPRAARPAQAAADPPVEAEQALFAPGEEVTAEALRERWPALMERLRLRQPGLVAFLHECKAEGIEGDLLRLVFGVEFQRDQARKRQEALQAFLEEQTGRRFAIRCEHREPEPPPESESERALKTVLNIFPGSELLERERASLEQSERASLERSERSGDVGSTEGQP